MSLGLAVAAIAALADWWAVLRERESVEAVAKPLVMVGLALAVLGGGDVTEVQHLLLLGAVLMSLLGDVLLLPRFDNFVGGLAAFLIGHVFYVAALVPEYSSARMASVGAGFAIVLVAAAGRRIIAGAARRSRSLRPAVSAYMAALVSLLTIGFGSGAALIAGGAALFVLSDTVLGWNRFVGALAHGRLRTHVLYHLGQAALVVGIVSTGG